MGPYKLIAVDLDDTLLNSHLDVSVENRNAILKAKAAGVAFTLATGRMYRSALPYAKKLNVDIPIITYQGALVKDPVSGQVITQRPLALDYALDILDIGYKKGYHMNVYLDDNLYVDHVTEEAEIYANKSSVPINPVGDLRNFLREDPAKVLFIADSELLDDLYLELKEKYPKLYITKSQQYYLEIMNPLATKGHALKELAHAMGISRDQVIAMGDSYNDMDMIEYAGLGVAMGNAWDAVKKVADYVTDTHNHNGVGKVIEKFIFGQDV